MEKEKLLTLLDTLVTKTENQDTFNSLNEMQKPVAAFENFIGTVTRSGASAFFTGSNAFMFGYVMKAITLFKGPVALSAAFEQAIKSEAPDALNQVNKIVVDEFEYLDDQKFNYVAENYARLKE